MSESAITYWTWCNKWDFVHILGKIPLKFMLCNINYIFREIIDRLIYPEPTYRVLLFQLQKYRSQMPNSTIIPALRISSKTGGRLKGFDMEISTKTVRICHHRPSSKVKVYNSRHLFLRNTRIRKTLSRKTRQLVRMEILTLTPLPIWPIRNRKWNHVGRLYIWCSKN